MTYAMARASKAYANIGAQTSVEAASPHRLIQLLYAGAIDRISRARGHMQRNDVADKGLCISRAIDIVDSLRASLDTRHGHPLAHNLESLYDYMCRRLLQANNDNDVAPLDEVSHLLAELKSAWDAIPSELHRGAPEVFDTQMGNAQVVGA
ncbi:flagellar protein FliS [Paraperlucidibaca baekdonensis]|uniref:Flagellar secretion chaperone FliS n=1 Tax=Paraperlucidibaca baekdonensis TaxID=748120 RepID=A0A3E0H119_9GAMM|nr:flagellar export chaperone FliS [Paraperlucidibaca baekdonensis]REH36753.1 flagellar protein FliS [Paraperlucidibaca baekdonensis]